MLVTSASCTVRFVLVRKVHVSLVVGALIFTSLSSRDCPRNSASSGHQLTYNDNVSHSVIYIQRRSILDLILIIISG